METATGGNSGGRHGGGIDWMAAGDVGAATGGVAEMCEGEGEGLRRGNTAGDGGEGKGAR